MASRKPVTDSVGTCVELQYLGTVVSRNIWAYLSGGREVQHPARTQQPVQKFNQAG